MLATVGVLVQSFVHLPDPERHAFSNTRPLGALLQARLFYARWIDVLAALTFSACSHGGGGGGGGGVVVKHI